MNEIVASRIILFETMFNLSSPNNKRLLSASLSKTEKSNSGMSLSPGGGGGTWIQNDGGVHAYDSFCEPALEKIAKNHTRH